MRDPGVRDQQREAGVGEPATAPRRSSRVVEVDQQRGPGRREQRDRLVHAAGRGARRPRSRPGCRPGPGRCRRSSGQVRAERARDRGGDGALQGGRAGQAGAERDACCRRRCRRPGRRGRPRRSAHSTPAAYAAHPVAVARAEVRRRPRSSRSACCRLTTCTRPSSAVRHGGVRRVGEGHRQAQAARCSRCARRSGSPGPVRASDARPARGRRRARSRPGRRSPSSAGSPGAIRGMATP